ncbi:MAG TPA: glycosyltransferase family 4 protein [Pyrinomonadaceae bacterium]
MRIAVVNWSRRRAGGVETYLGGVIRELLRSGHEIAFWHECDKPADRERIALPEGIPVWSVETLGARGALDALKEWRPDLLYSHGMLDPALESATLELAPAVFFAHSYYGTCISGSKTFRRPIVRPCGRSFGWQCLVNYYPRGCGGRSPVTMFREYWRQSARLDLLHRYDAIVTHSGHIQEELIKHGLSVRSAYKFPYYVNGAEQALMAGDLAATAYARNGEANANGDALGGRDGKLADERGRHLLFVGRMDALKGGSVLVDALPRVRKGLGVPLRVTFAGDGPARRAWERRAARVEGRNEGLHFEFPGWLGGERINALLGACDLLVVPSLWPEPFGLVGPEAGLRGVPVAAFGVGGIPDWLIDGVNGRVAPGDPPTVAGLSEAIVDCLRDPVRHAEMRREAVRLAQKYNMKNHLAALLDVFEGVVRREREKYSISGGQDARPVSVLR